MLKYPTCVGYVVSPPEMVRKRLLFVPMKLFFINISVKVTMFCRYASHFHVPETKDHSNVQVSEMGDNSVNHCATMLAQA